MTHRAYANLWARDTSESTLLDRFEQFLATVPLSASHPEFTHLVIRAVGPAETPIVEHDLRGANAGPPDVIALAKQYPDPDTEYEVGASWNLWQPSVQGADQGAWERGPSPLLLLCRGNTYDDGVAVQSGPFEADLGFERLFIGEEEPPAANERVSQNVKQLFDWLRTLETTLPIERYQLWSEGEEHFEARLDDILSLH